VRTTIYTTAALQYLAVFAGLGWAEAARSHPECVPNLWLVPAALGLALLVAAAYTTRAHAPSPGGVAARRLIAAMLVYAGLIVLLDPFADATDEANCLLGVALALVPLLCLKVLVRERAWLAVWGVILSPDAAVASLYYNAANGWGGHGYFSFMYQVCLTHFVY
jgi:hypothetical protein